MDSHEKKPIKIKIQKKDLLSAEAIININIMFLINARKGVKNKKGEKAIYELHGKTHKQMKKYIKNLPSDHRSNITQINIDFPTKTYIYNQCAYYFRAYSRSQIFLDANHRTGFFSLALILRKKGIIINADVEDIVGLTEYIRGMGWLKMGELGVNLKEKDDEYHYLVKWFTEKLEFR